MQKNFLCPNCKRENTSQAVNCAYCGALLGVMGSFNAHCPHCRWPRQPSHRFCGNCGQPLQPMCPNCGNYIDKDSRYCPKCSFFCGGGREGLL